MDTKDLKSLFKKNENSDMLSRRDALKLMGISPIAAGVLASTTSSSISSAEASSATGKIVIVGAGSGGIMAAARLSKALSNPDITVIAPN
jgi:sulfide:quinone oxidoreductase